MRRLVPRHSSYTKTDSVLLNAHAINALQRPAEKDWRSVVDWIYSSAPLVAHEQLYIRKREDLVTLRKGRECANFDIFVERMLLWIDDSLSWCGWKNNIIKASPLTLSAIRSNERPPRHLLTPHTIQRTFVTAELRAKTSNGIVRYYDSDRLDHLANLVIIAIILILLVLPVAAMYATSNSSQTSPFEAIGILMVFTMVFGTAMSSLTRATRQELFAASAAYCAVLVVFIGNFSIQTVEIAEV